MFSSLKSLFSNNKNKYQALSTSDEDIHEDPQNNPLSSLYYPAFEYGDDQYYYYDDSSPPAYETTKSSTTDYVETRVNYDTFGEKDAWTVANMVPVPVICDRCREYPPQIRCLNKAQGTLEFICYQCREEDSSINRLVVRPRK